jgi:hypothetical protein
MCYRGGRKEAGKDLKVGVEQNTTKRRNPAMGKITQDKKFRQALLKHAEKYGVTAAARKYKTTRQYVYYWRKRWDGTVGSLGERSRRPRRHPNERTEEEKALIRETRRANPRDGLVVLWVKLGFLGYTRSVAGLFRAMRRP